VSFLRHSQRLLRLLPKSPFPPLSPVQLDGTGLGKASAIPELHSGREKRQGKGTRTALSASSWHLLRAHRAVRAPRRMDLFSSWFSDSYSHLCLRFSQTKSANSAFRRVLAEIIAARERKEHKDKELIPCPLCVPFRLSFILQKDWLGRVTGHRRVSQKPLTQRLLATVLSTTVHSWPYASTTNRGTSAGRQVLHWAARRAPPTRCDWSCGNSRGPRAFRLEPASEKGGAGRRLADRKCRVQRTVRSGTPPWACSRRAEHQRTAGRDRHKAQQERGQLRPQVPGLWSTRTWLSALLTTFQGRISCSDCGHRGACGMG